MEGPVRGIDTLAALIRDAAAGRDRLIVAIAGPPCAGKSTLSAALAQNFNGADPGCCAVVAMDGFHFDNAVLEPRGWIARKGAPHTFDAAGLAALLGRLARRERYVAIPLFDRERDLSLAGAAIVAADTRIVLVEGNYLLLDDPPWSPMVRYFGLTIGLEVPFDELERRLIQRWLDHGHPRDAAEARARANDIPNARSVVERSRQPDIVYRAA